MWSKKREMKQGKKPHLHTTATRHNKFGLFVRWWCSETRANRFFLSLLVRFSFVHDVHLFNCTMHVVNKMVVIAMPCSLFYVMFLLTTSWFAQFRLTVYFGQWNRHTHTHRKRKRGESSTEKQCNHYCWVCGIHSQKPAGLSSFFCCKFRLAWFSLFFIICVMCVLLLSIVSRTANYISGSVIAHFEHTTPDSGHKMWISLPFSSWYVAIN